MKCVRGWVIAIVSAIIGICAASLVMELRKQDQRVVRAKTDWLICTRANMDVISDAVDGFTRTNSNRPVTLEMLVKAGRIPEWSEVWLCPAWFDVQLPPKTYDDSFRSNLLLHPGVAAYYGNCSYYLEPLTNGVRVRCRSHTNELNYVVPLGKGSR